MNSKKQFLESRLLADIVLDALVEMAEVKGFATTDIISSYEDFLSRIFKTKSDIRDFKFSFYSAMALMRRGLRIKVEDFDGWIELKGIMDIHTYGDVSRLSIEGGVLKIIDRGDRVIDINSKKAGIIKESIKPFYNDQHLFSIYFDTIELADY